MENFVTIKEFAALANVTTQAVYKRINQTDGDFQRKYIRLNGKLKLISTEALKEFSDMPVQEETLFDDINYGFNADTPPSHPTHLNESDFNLDFDDDIQPPSAPPVFENNNKASFTVQSDSSPAHASPPPVQPAPPSPSFTEEKALQIISSAMNETNSKLVESLESHINDLKKEVETLRGELAEKNLQLHNLNERLANEQELHRHNQILLSANQENEQPPTVQVEPEKKSFLQKMFGK